MKKETITIIISTIAIIFSVIALCFTMYRPPYLQFDYIGAIVGVLSILVTALIGWQFYNYMSLRSEMEKKMNEVLNEAVTKMSYAMAGYINARTSSIWGRSADLSSLDNAFAALKEIKLSKGISCYDFALDFSINKIIEYINEIKSKDGLLAIAKDKKSIYNHILRDIDHEKVGYIIEELNK